MAADEKYFWHLFGITTLKLVTGGGEGDRNAQYIPQKDLLYKKMRKKEKMELNI